MVSFGSHYSAFCAHICRTDIRSVAHCECKRRGHVINFVAVAVSYRHTESVCCFSADWRLQTPLQLVHNFVVHAESARRN